MLTKDFLFGGAAIFTVVNDKGDYYTFRVSKKDDSPFFAGLLTGPDNNSNYTYMGLLNKDGTIRLTAKSKYTTDSLPVKVLAWAAHLIVNQKPLPDGYSIKHEGKCGRCGRRLTTPESIERGIGPECWRMMGH